MKARNSSILNGSPFKAITFLLWPLLMSGIFQQLYTVADGIIVGQNLGPNALAVLGRSPSNLVGIFNNLSTGLISGALVIIAQANGANDRKKMAAVITNGLFLVFVLSAVIMLVYFLAGQPLLSFLKVPESLMDDSLTYLRFYIWGFIPYSFTMLLINLQRGMGETRRPNFMLSLNYVLYIIFDFLFIIIMKTGMQGVPLAYIATYVVSMVIMLVTTTRDYDLLNGRQFLDGKIMKEIIRVGVPAAVTSVFFAISSALITTCMNRLGADVVASYSVANKIANVMWIVMSALATATVTMVATCYGAGKKERIQPALNASAVIGMGSTALIWIICHLWQQPLLQMFSSDPEILRQSGGILDFLTTMFFLYPFLEVYGAAIKGTGHAMIHTVITLVCVGVARFVWLLGFPHLLTDVYRVLLAFPLGWALTSLSAFVCFQIKKKDYLK